MSKTIIDPCFFTSGSECLNAFYDGKVDMAFMGSIPFIMGKASGVPIKILALVNRSKGGEAVLFNPNMDPTFNRNHTYTIGTVYGSTAHYLLMSYAKTAIPPISYYPFYMSPELQLDAFRNGFIDAVSLWEPFVSYAVNSFDARVTFDDSRLPGGGINLLVVREGYAAENPDVVHRILEVLQSGTDWITNHMQKADEILCRLLQDPNASAYSLNHLNLSRYDWHMLAYSDQLVSEGIHKELLDISSSLTADNLAASFSLYPANIFQSKPEELGSNTERKGPEIKIGYSLDMMCASFLICGTLNLWEENGFFLPKERQLLTERIIHYDYRTQESLLRIIHDMKHNSSKSAAIKLRALLERALRSLTCKFDLKISRTTSKVTLFSYLEALQNAQLVPEYVHSYSHLIRLFGNEQAHDSSINEPDLPLLLELTMRIFDWTYSDGSGQCPNCNMAVNLEWRFCAGCGQELTHEKRTEDTCLPLDGNDIMEALNLKPGPFIGKALLLIRSKIENGESLTKDEALQVVETFSIEEGLHQKDRLQ